MPPITVWQGVSAFESAKKSEVKETVKSDTNWNKFMIDKGEAKD